MKSVTEKSLNFNKMIKVNFDGGNLTSDAGLLLYKEFDEKIGLSQSIQETFQVNDSVHHRKHSNDEVIIQKIYQHITGYHTDDHADELKHEPMFTTILEKDQLASQPTLSRLNQKFDKETMKQLQQVNQTLNERIQAIKPSDHFVFDLDSANFTTCGNQYETNYNAHYQTNGYHPLVLFDGLTGDCMKAVLRAGNVYTSRNVVGFVGPVIKDYKKMSPRATIVVRGDSGFAVPALYELCEEQDIKYAIRLKSNKRLTSMAQDIENEIRHRMDINNGAPYVFYKEMTYKAANWNKSRRVIVKLERPEGELFFRYSFIVTNLSYRPKNIVKFYQNRGTMENFIKEGKNGFAF
ncbi:IS1380 family transposase, partial [Virgibacillus pantothenticus]|uniref:IS1380 family transposase n=1 Tax=Virgibacillus pantothenticus TaxID=1473 RepID=UPI000985DE73